MDVFLLQTLSTVIAILVTLAGNHVRKEAQKKIEEHKKSKLEPFLLITEARDWIEANRDYPCKGCNLPTCLFCKLDAFLSKNQKSGYISTLPLAIPEKTE